MSHGRNANVAVVVIAAVIAKTVFHAARHFSAARSLYADELLQMGADVEGLREAS